jgi:DNA-directed RNA polymerase subunit RPC12/RpoP
MCPYCGEDVPDDSTSCWKCGTELSKGGAADGDEPKLEQRAEKQGGPTAECPYCQATILAKALRCNECGRAVQKGGPRSPSAVPAVLGAFALVLAVTGVGLLYAFVAGRKPPADPGRDDPAKQVQRSFVELERVYLKQGGNEQRRRELWQSEHGGKFVRQGPGRPEWPAVVVSIDAATRTVGLADSGTAARPSVLLQLRDDQELSALKKEKAIRYSARLVDFRDGQFHLDLGILE